MRTSLLVAGLALAGIAQGASAEVTDRSEAGFATRDTRIVGAAPDEVWAALIEPAGWWSAAHSWSGDAANLALEPRAGGCFCERLPGAEAVPAGSVEHMTVIHAAPGALLRMRGALGPLQAEALAATLTIELEPAAGGTEIAWSYVVGGMSRIALEQIAPAVDGVMSEQLDRLAAFVESGSPTGE